MGRKSDFDDRNWNRRPLFGERRRRYGHWIFLIALLLVSTLLFLFPGGVMAFLAPLFV